MKVKTDIPFNATDVKIIYWVKKQELTKLYGLRSFEREVYELFKVVCGCVEHISVSSVEDLW